ncbi:CBS domain-containing protein [Bacillaceae bacterium SIJ1]|uniref:CBS domain-containing protein n=1 Tax=Litoribacterium kuwaitense TaxID=1398745 RepID=UPI0013ECA7D4|nr:CBS domain-containing protein [Litoribacterium kuwaitense]NGP46502.1 CBS domain-containing protein [Litoribacterium kuwaitense]
MNVAFFLLPKQEVAFIYHDFTVRQALEKMKYHRYSSIPIVDRDGQYVGTLSEGDLLWHIYETNSTQEELSRQPISAVKRYRYYEPISVDANMEGLFAQAADQNFVPVVDDEGRFIGIIRRSEIINELMLKEKRSGARLETEDRTSLG